MSNNRTIAVFLNSATYRWGLRALFFLFNLLFLCWHQDILFQISCKNYFLDNQVFQSMTLGASAGALAYAGRWMNLIFDYPLVAAVVIALLLSLIEFCVSWLFDRAGKIGWLTYLPSICLLSTLTFVGYALYDKLEISWFFASLIGICVALLLYAGYQFFSNRNWASWVVMLLALLLYKFIGIYAVLAMALVALNELKSKKDWKPLVVAVVALFALPLLTKILLHERFMHVFWAPLPDSYFVELFIPLCVAMLVLATLAGLKKEVLEKYATALSVLPIAYMIVVVSICLNDNYSTFRKEMNLVRLCDEHRWNDILARVDGKEPITRTMNAYRVIALANTKQLSNHLFSVSLPFKPSPSTYRSEIAIYYVDLYYYSSFFSVDLNMVMEQWVTFGETHFLLRRLAHLALLKEEPDLFARYVRIMKQSPSLKKEALELEKYQGDLKGYSHDAYLSQLKSMEVMEDCSLPTRMHISEMYKIFSQLKVENIEYRLLADLYSKDLNLLLKDVARAKSVYSYFPAYVQEAIVLKALQTNNPRLMSIIPVDTKLAQKVQQFVQKVSMMSEKNREKNAQKLFETYGDMYCYYFMLDDISYNTKE